MTETKSIVFRFADVEVREREFCLVKAGEVLPVEPKTFRVLLFLLRNPQKLIAKEELLNAIWGDAVVTDSSLTRTIAQLRRLLGDEIRNSRYIETVATVGYRWVCKVEVADESSGEGERQTAPVLPDAEEKKAVGSKRMWTRTLGSGSVLAFCLVGGIWYLSRPLPPPKITAYFQVTHDGHRKILGGTDGSRLYFTQSSPLTIKQVGVNGGEVAQVPINVPATEMALLDVSPDGSSALIATNEVGHVANPIWLAPLLGGSARRLRDGESERFSPDGLSMIYWTLEGDIFLARTDGTENRKLAHVGSLAHSFRWSPDLKTIRFTEGGSLWEMSSAGSGLHRLLPDWKEPGTQCCGTWTTDGSLYLFVVSPPSESQIWALDERRRPFRTRSSTPIRLTTGPMQWNRLIPSRDGTRIFAEGFTRRGELSRIDPKTGAFQPLLGGISAEFASFSPDGKSVAYVLFPEGTLWKADQDGSNRVQLTGGPDQILNPRWSPDSKQILFTKLSDPMPSSIHLLSVDGGKPHRLLPGDETATGDANWSPDGKNVVFDRGGAGATNRDLRILDLGTGKVIVIPGSSGMFSPRWSADGRFVLARYTDSRPTLPVFDLKTHQWSLLPVNGGANWLSFSRDGRYIYFLRFGRDQGVIRIRVTGGKEERVIDLAKWPLAGHFGFSMTLDPSDAPLVMRDVGSDDIYALTLDVKGRRWNQPAQPDNDR